MSITGITGTTLTFNKFDKTNLVFHMRKNNQISQFVCTHKFLLIYLKFWNVFLNPQAYMIHLTLLRLVNLFVH